MWEMLGAVAGIGSFLALIILEWDKIKDKLEFTSKKAKEYRLESSNKRIEEPKEDIEYEYSRRPHWVTGLLRSILAGISRSILAGIPLGVVSGFIYGLKRFDMEEAIGFGIYISSIANFIGGLTKSVIWGGLITFFIAYYLMSFYPGNDFDDFWFIATALISGVFGGAINEGLSKETKKKLFNFLWRLKNSLFN